MLQLVKDILIGEIDRRARRREQGLPDESDEESQSSSSSIDYDPDDPVHRLLRWDLWPSSGDASRR